MLKTDGKEFLHVVAQFSRHESGDEGNLALPMHASRTAQVSLGWAGLDWTRATSSAGRRKKLQIRQFD